MQGTLGQVEHEMRKSTLVIIGLLLLCCTLFAAPAKRGVVIMTQPDGTTFQALLKGDEFVKVKTTLQGQAIVQEEDGWWCYAAFAPDGSRHSTGFRVGSETPVSVMQESQNIPFNALASAASLTRQQLRQVENHLQTRAGQGTQATKHVLVILVEYSDVKFTYGKSSFENLLINKGYSHNGATGSAKDYFEAQFGDKVKFEFEVSNVAGLSKKRAYYGGNTTSGDDKAPAEMVKDACVAVDSHIDFSKYDDDGDGVVDNVFIFFAGPDEAEGASDECIWSHSWALYRGAGISLTLDGKMIDSYACASELSLIVQNNQVQSVLTGIGTFCHEFSHTLGLPDMYDTDYEGLDGWAAGLWGSTSIMDAGNQNNNNNTPPNYNAIEREILGLAEPVILDNSATYTLPPIHSSNLCYRMNTDAEGEYFLFECRAKTGWDAYIGGSGMLVYHIDKRTQNLNRWIYQNTVNSNKDHQCADLIEADARRDYFTDQADRTNTMSNIRTVFFPSGNVNSLTGYGTPPFVFWSGKHSENSITGIKKDGDNVTFSYLTSQGESAPPYPDDIVVEPFCDGAIVRFSSSYLYDGPAIVRWSRAGKIETVVSVDPYQSGSYVLLLEGLEPAGKTYTVEIWFERFGLEGEVKEVSFLTKRAPQVTWPYIYLNSVSRESDGSFMAGTRIPMRLYNASKAEQVEWYMDDKPIIHEGDWYYTLTESGTLKAVVRWEDGSVDIITKEVVVK